MQVLLTLTSEQLPVSFRLHELHISTVGLSLFMVGHNCSVLATYLAAAAESGVSLLKCIPMGCCAAFALILALMSDKHCTQHVALYDDNPANICCAVATAGLLNPLDSLPCWGQALEWFLWCSMPSASWGTCADHGERTAMTTLTGSSCSNSCSTYKRCFSFLTHNCLHN